MFSYLLVTGPPFDKALWADVGKRICERGHQAMAVAMFTDGDGSLHTEAKRIALHIEEAEHPVVLIAHGAAIPAAIEAILQQAPAGLVLSNGPIDSVDRFTQGLMRWANLPRTFTEKLISPARTMSLLASSIGLRRLVVNPYVMDHDTTVTVCGPIFESKERLARMRNYLQALSKRSFPTLPNNIITLICRGDADILSSCDSSTLINNLANGSESSPVPGGRYLHPIERPWELADRSIGWAEKQLTTT
jgi:hypothetical protein